MYVMFNARLKFERNILTSELESQPLSPSSL